MTTERFTPIIEDNKIVGIESHNNPLTMEQVIKQLNDYEATRKRKNHEISKFRKREEKYQRIIGGIMAYMELNVNNELWWDWNDD